MNFLLSCMTLSCLRPRETREPERRQPVNVVRLLFELYSKASQTKRAYLNYGAQEHDTGAEVCRADEDSAQSPRPVKVRSLCNKVATLASAILTQDCKSVVQATTRSGKFVAWIKKPFKGLPGQKALTQSPVSAAPVIDIQVLQTCNCTCKAAHGNLCSMYQMPGVSRKRALASEIPYNDPMWKPLFDTVFCSADF